MHRAGQRAVQPDPRHRATEILGAPKNFEAYMNFCSVVFDDRMRTNFEVQAHYCVRTRLLLPFCFVQSLSLSKNQINSSFIFIDLFNSSLNFSLPTFCILSSSIYPLVLLVMSRVPVRLKNTE